MKSKTVLRTFLRRLTNLSGNNRSLLLLRLHAEQLLDVHSFSFLNGEPSFGIIKALIEGRDKKLCQIIDSRIEANNEMSCKLKRLQRIDRFIFEERGSNDLHVGWPLIRGKFIDGTPVRCPLIYFPVVLVQQGAFWVLQLRPDVGVTFNKSFLLAYSYYNKINVDNELLDYNLDDLSNDDLVFRTQLYELLKSRIELNFNPETFQDQLIPFASFKKSEFEEAHRDGEIKLFPEAVLGIFPQAGSHLVPDYLHLLENIEMEDLEDFFESKVSNVSSEQPVGEKIIKEENLFTPFLIDAYQESAIHTIKNGHSIVVQGPPGTGKSQLICNLMADAMASGKNVLLVCQKRAALDVVYNRMSAMELGGFLGLVHDFRNDRKEIFGKIARQIDRIEEFKARNRSVDVIQTERKFFQVCRRIDQITEELQEFKNALYSDKDCGASVKELYMSSDPYATAINLKQEYHYFSFTDLEEFIRKIKLYALYAKRFEKDDYAWKHRKSFADFAPSDEQKIEDTFSDIEAYQKKISSEIFRLLGIALNLEDCEGVWQKKEEVLGMISILKSDITYRFFQAMCYEAEDETSMLWLSNKERLILNCFDDDGPEASLATDMLGKFQEILYERMRSRRNLFRSIRWELFSKNKFIIKRVLVANDLAYNKYGLKVLESRIDSRLNLEHQLTDLKMKSWLMELPLDYKKESYRAWFKHQKLAIRAKHVFNSLREIKEGIAVRQLAREGLISLLKRVLNVIEGLPEKKSGWQRYLSPYHIRLAMSTETLENKIIQTLRHDFDSLCDFDRLRQNLKSFEQEVILKLFDHVKVWDEEAMVALFQNSLRLAWIEHLEMKYPVLRAVSSFKMDELQKELQQCVAEKQKLSEEIVLLRVREKAYEEITYNRLNNPVTYRDLHHQVTKKKKIWPVRKVMAEYHKELFQLIPCWMASPESVSAIFPMDGLFDVVIFDEASQCFAEQGIPAMYRGKQVVIAGDDQQLKPNELYQVRWDDETESPDLEVQSLLQLADRYLNTVHLQGHYRSQSLELIEFSNRHFYNYRLKLLPDRHILNRNEPAIEFYKVSGIWENQTNIIEAETVMEHLFELLRTSPSKEIGIVTFNAPQQMLIHDIVEAEAAQRGIDLPSSLFIKNIENVQGDERDIIIFSVGYAPDKKGKVSMQFGSLNVSGGENRLNVAVTRARERIILFSSIWPEQLKTEDSKNEGPKLLRQYLTFAKEVQDKRFTPATPASSGNASHWVLSAKIQEWSKNRLQNFEFLTNALPNTDLVVKQDDRYLGIILTDDEHYYSSISMKDIYAYTPALFTQKNWNYRLVYSRNFWKEADTVENNLLLFVGSQK